LGSTGASLAEGIPLTGKRPRKRAVSGSRVRRHTSTYFCVATWPQGAASSLVSGGGAAAFGPEGLPRERDRNQVR